MERTDRHVRGQDDGQETAAIDGGLQVSGCAGALEGSKTVRQ